MADTGYSVFAPFARGPLHSGPAVTGGRIDQSAIRIDDARCDHKFTLAPLPPQLVKRPQEPAAEDPSTRRTKIWEFSQNLHCSIIGTCLSTTELRQTLTRFGLAQNDWTDHDLHHKAVSLAAKHDQAAKLLHKALDRRHKLSISQFGKARTEAELIALWRDAVKRGDIPGAYWAVLTHPGTTQAVVRLVFGEVHMLSHLVGAANRADIRRLCDLEQRNAELEARLRRQQEALHQAVVTRDASIRDLRQSLRQRLFEEAPVATGDESAALRALVADLERRLAAETRRRAAVEARLAETRDDLSREHAARATLETETATLRVELASIEADLQPATETLPWRVDGMTLLYVGGRPHQVAQLRALSAGKGAELLHHDGGIEHHPDLLAGLTSRADVVLFPVDCVSHDAALTVKRLCRQTAKRFIPLRSAGTTSFLAALRPLGVTQAAAE
ncbi:MAG: DUF2325 domain-containing protein [Acetobacteraceae bacterium]|jgi:hypothetical protein